MTELRSGNVNTGTNTPTGAKKKIAVDNPYITVDDFCNSYTAKGLGINITDPLVTSGELQDIILQASAWLNRKANMYFDTQTIDETKTAFTVRPYNPQLVTVVLNNRPYSKINRCWIQVLKWFIEVDVSSPNSYIQDFYDYGYFKIVPLLSSSGQGVGSPIPSNIIDRIALGVLWYNYTFGYGTPLLSQVLTSDNAYKVYQAPVGNRLWAPDQTLNVYIDGSLVNPTMYSVDYVNGKVTFNSALTSSNDITADFTTNQSIPADIKKAAILLTAHLIGQDLQNALGANSMGIQTWNTSFGDKSKVEERVDALLAPYTNNTPKIL